MRCEQHIPFKEDLFKLVGTMEHQMRKAGVDIRLNTEVTKDYVEKIAPDVLVVAVGAQPIVPNIPGIDKDKVILANDICTRESEVGDKVVVLGGGLVGSELAVHLAQLNKDVTIVEMLDDIAIDANGRHRPILLDKLEELCVDVKTGLKGIAITDTGIVCQETCGDNEITLDADTIICAVGQRPLHNVVEGLHDAAPEIVQVGDCIKAQKVTEAIRRGYYAALDI